MYLNLDTESRMRIDVSLGHRVSVITASNISVRGGSSCNCLQLCSVSTLYKLRSVKEYSLVTRQLTNPLQIFAIKKQKCKLNSVAFSLCVRRSNIQNCNCTYCFVWV